MSFDINLNGIFGIPEQIRFSQDPFLEKFQYLENLHALLHYILHTTSTILHTTFYIGGV